MADIPYISLFSGAGALDLGFKIAFPAARCIGYVEINVEAAEILVSRIDEGSLENAPIWSDVRTFPSRKYRGRVAGLVAGFPCPDYSVAGKRAGIVGKHGQLWDYLRDAIREVGPEWCLLENVPGIYVPHGTDDGSILPAGLWFVLGDLADLGFDAEWLRLRASAVGASHGRSRWFCLAYRKGRGRRILRESSQCRERFINRSREGVANAIDGQFSESIGRSQTGNGPRSTGPFLDDTARKQFERREYDRGSIAPRKSDLGELPIFAPGPGERELWADLLVRYPWLRPAVAQAEAQSDLRGIADGLADLVGEFRTDALRAIGNGVVPLQVAVASRELVRRAMKE